MDRIEAYSLLSSLIYKGFLTVDMVVSDKSFIFKTINNQELSFIKTCSGHPDKSGYRRLFDLNFIAHSLLSVNGENLLELRKRDICLIVDMFSSMPSKLAKRIGNELESISELSFQALKFIEGFCYTTPSRRAWRLTGGLPPNDERFTGIPGSSSLGLNYFQETWSLINRNLDEEDDYNKEFSLALFIASATNPKGTKSARSQQDSRMQNSQERRNKLAEVGFIDTENWSAEKWAAPVDTAEELVAELERQMKGKKDRHDLFIDEHMRKIKDQSDKIAQETSEKIRRHREEEGTIHELISGSQRALTPEETAALMARRRSPGHVKILDEDNNVDLKDKERFMTKIGGRILTSKS